MSVFVCDACGAPSRVTLVLPSGLPLDFCRHHYLDHGGALPTGTRVVSSRGFEFTPHYDDSEV